MESFTRGAKFTVQNDQCFCVFVKFRELAHICLTYYGSSAACLLEYYILRGASNRKTLLVITQTSSDITRASKYNFHNFDGIENDRG